MEIISLRSLSISIDDIGYQSAIGPIAGGCNYALRYGRMSQNGMLNLIRLNSIPGDFQLAVFSSQEL
jgi:hypothetical protein